MGRLLRSVLRRIARNHVHVPTIELVKELQRRITVEAADFVLAHMTTDTEFCP